MTSACPHGFADAVFCRECFRDACKPRQPSPEPRGRCKKCKRPYAGPALSAGQAPCNCAPKPSREPDVYTRADYRNMREALMQAEEYLKNALQNVQHSLARTYGKKYE